MKIIKVGKELLMCFIERRNSNGKCICPFVHKSPPVRGQLTFSWNALLCYEMALKRGFYAV